MNTHNPLLNMISQQLRTGDVLAEDILKLYENIPREDFVPPEFINFAYSDMQIPLNHHQCMLTPLEEGKILQALNLTGKERVLEIGTGSGFFTALLASLSAQVITIDYYTDFTQRAREKLANYNLTNVDFIRGDACRGWLQFAPYDIIVFTGAIAKVTSTHKLQLLPGGKLFAIVGAQPAMQGLVYKLDINNKWSLPDVIFETSVPPLIDKLNVSRFIF